MLRIPLIYSVSQQIGQCGLVANNEGSTSGLRLPIQVDIHRHQYEEPFH
jgi:hypothetical protein